MAREPRKGSRMVTRIEDYLADGCGRCPRFASPDCSARSWAEGLAALREICLSCGLTETVKWGHPCYGHAGRNIAILGAHRADFRLSFFEPGLLAAQTGLERQGPNSPHPDTFRFRVAAEVSARAPEIRECLHAAMGFAENGVRPSRAPRQIEMPKELAAALDADPDLATAFGALTPGRQRSYTINLNLAKTAATRVARIAKFRPAILAGKGATER